MTAATRPARDLCIMACVFCRDPLFREWLAELSADGTAFTEDAAKAFILTACQVESRSELDTDAAAGERFHQLVRAPFLAWKDEQSGAVPAWVAGGAACA